MSLGKLVILLGGLGLGTAAVSYFADEKYGKRRRIHTRKKVDQVMKTANHKLDEFSRQFANHSRQFANQTGEISRDLKNQVGKQATDFAKNVQKPNRWKPSSRMLGALGSGLAFYGASRQGLLGLACRTMSLTMFTRALLSPR